MIFAKRLLRALFIVFAFSLLQLSNAASTWAIEISDRCRKCSSAGTEFNHAYSDQKTRMSASCHLTQTSMLREHWLSCTAPTPTVVGTRALIRFALSWIPVGSDYRLCATSAFTGQLDGQLVPGSQPYNRELAL